ncbi:lipase family protein [Mycolicibacterium sp. GCM10028919]|uniref:lipase family protein n=1 Tax=Mycolicibacterium sp. GCM10028919 TaxID=3273401 RepID=UPI003607D685
MTRRSVLLIAVPLLLVIVVAVTAILLVGRSGGKGTDATAVDAPEPISTADLTDAGPGSLVSAVKMPDFDRTNFGRSIRSARVLYRSTSGDDGAPTVVSGTVFTPIEAPPPGGWPIVSFGHGTLGWQERCGPSLSTTLLGQVDAVQGFINRGYAVAMADYQGLGAPGVHPYSDAKTAGLNMIDAVRALRRTFDGVSDRWAAMGGSQGGGAAWAADEQAAVYAPELNLVGAVGLSPAADVAGLVDKAVAGTLTIDQGPVLQGILYSLARLHPDLNLDDYRHGAAVRYWDVLSSCGGPDVHDRTDAMKALGPNDFKPSSDAAADLLRGYLTAWALPQRPLSAPLYVEFGSDDTFIDPAWTRAAIARACALGGVVDWREDPLAGHGDVDWGNGLTWLDDRFEGRPVANECA